MHISFCVDSLKEMFSLSALVSVFRHLRCLRLSRRMLIPVGQALCDRPIWQCTDLSPQSSSVSKYFGYSEEGHAKNNQKLSWKTRHLYLEAAYLEFFGFFASYLTFSCLDLDRPPAAVLGWSSRLLLPFWRGCSLTPTDRIHKHRHEYSVSSGKP